VIRKTLRNRLASALFNWPITIISDDCWAGQLYKLFDIPFSSPTIGLWIEPGEYLSFVEHITSPDAFVLTFDEIAEQRFGYPVGQTPYATIHFMHYKTSRSAQEAFQRRATRINWKRFFVKIDFGKPGYTETDVMKWDELALENSVAFCPYDRTSGPLRPHRGIAIHGWVLDGARMFIVSTRFFSIFDWLRDGALHTQVLSLIKNNFLIILFRMLALISRKQ